MNRVLVVIPARRKSSRFPDKIIALLDQKPLMMHAYSNAKQLGPNIHVVLAVDDLEIFQIAQKNDACVMMTSNFHCSGTDRVWEVAAQHDCDIILNLQCDEPLITKNHLEQLILPLIKNAQINMATIITDLEPEEVNNSNVVKVVIDKNFNAMYFSRCTIPFQRDLDEVKIQRYKHIGVYAYRKDILEKITQLEPTFLEKTEKLEQLRALEYGINIHTVYIENLKLIGVDTPEDLEKAENLLKDQR